MLQVKMFDGIKKTRYGSKNDGGYIHVDNIINYDCIISCGISANIDFEEAISKQYPKIPILAFDGTIKQIPKHNIQNLTFIKKNINVNNTSTTTNLDNYINQYSNILLKMDIEGAEWPYFDNIEIKKLLKFKQIIVEFHYLNKTDKIRINSLSKLETYFHLFHVHANNVRMRLFKAYGTKVTRFMEFTYVRKDCLTHKNIIPNTLPLPDPLIDSPNLLDRSSDINLNYYPFVNTISCPTK